MAKLRKRDFATLELEPNCVGSNLHVQCAGRLLDRVFRHRRRDAKRGGDGIDYFLLSLLLRPVL